LNGNGRDGRVRDGVMVEGRVDRYDLAVAENVVGGDRGGVCVSENEGELEVIPMVNVVVLLATSVLGVAAEFVDDSSGDVKKRVGRVSPETWRRRCLCLHHSTICVYLLVFFCFRRIQKRERSLVGAKESV